MSRMEEGDILEILKRDDLSEIDDFSEEEYMQNEKEYKLNDSHNDNLYEDVDEKQQLVPKNDIIRKKGTYLSCQIDWYRPEPRNIINLDHSLHSLQYFSRYITQDIA